MQITAVNTTNPDAKTILAEYFDYRTKEFAALGQAAPRAGYRTAPPSPFDFVPPSGVFLLGKENDKALACGGIRRIEADDTETVSFELKHLFVRPEARGTGAGSVMLVALIESARAVGGQRLVLDTHSSLTAAAKLYARMGFTSIPPYNSNPNANRWYALAL